MTRFALVLLLCTGCASTTMILSQPDGARVDIDGATRGITPYAHTETVTLATKHTVSVRLQGYRSVTSQIAADQWQTGKIVASILCFWPGLFFSTEYPASYNFVLEPETGLPPQPPGFNPDGLNTSKPGL